MEYLEGDVLSFWGAMIGAAVSVLGTLWVANRRVNKLAKKNRSNLLSFLAMLEAKLNFTSSSEKLDEYIAQRNVPSFINGCALVLEMTELLETSAVADAAKGYRELYILHRLRRILKVWSLNFANYADIPFPDFYKISEPEDFRAAVDNVVIPATIIRGSVHLYMAEIAGKNVMLEEIAQQHPEEMARGWDPDLAVRPE